MYIPIGGDMAVREDTILGIFDLDTTSWAFKTREFLKRAEDEGAVIPVGDELPKSYLLTREMGMDRVYLTQFTSATMEKRLKKRRPDAWQTKF